MNSTSPPAAPLTPAELLFAVNPWLWKLAHRAARRCPALNVEDLHGEMCVLVLRYASKFDPARGKLTTWAFQVNRTTVDRACKAAAKHARFVATDVDYLATIPARVQPAAPDADEVAALRLHLHAIPSHERDVVVSRFGLGGRTPESLAVIARRRGCSRERVRQIERAALDRLRIRLAIHAPSHER